MPIDVSVVIPTRNHAASLGRTLEALEHQAGAAGRYEVIVVANDCVDATATLVRERRPPYPLRLIERAEPGIAGARNAGAAAAAGKLLVFLDDDVEACQEFVAAHLAAHGTGGENLVAVGALLTPPANGRTTMLVARLRRLAAEHQATSAAGFNWWLVTGGNMSIDAGCFACLGGFDANLIQYGGEDYEFAFRAHEAGSRFVWVAAASGWHHHTAQLSPAEYLERARHVGRHDAAIVRRHPGAAAYLPIDRADRAHTTAGKLARVLAFDHPWLGDVCAGVLAGGISLLEIMRWQRPWNRLVTSLYEYWYFRGIGLAIGGRAEVARFLSEIRRSRLGGA
jgi:glycosyltransferase involved in cell wall biosynthesis